MFSLIVLGYIYSDKMRLVSSEAKKYITSTLIFPKLVKLACMLMLVLCTCYKSVVSCDAAWCFCKHLFIEVKTNI